MDISTKINAGLATGLATMLGSIGTDIHAWSLSGTAATDTAPAERLAFDWKLAAKRYALSFIAGFGVGIGLPGFADTVGVQIHPAA